MPFSADAQDVRVRLFGGNTGSKVHLSSPDGPLDVTVDGRPLASARRGERVDVEVGPDGLRIAAEDVRTDGRRVEVTGSGSIRVRSGRYDRRYTGSVHLTRVGRTIRAVNHVPMEPYVASVVASEYPFSEIEGVKAQAVLARTYALRHRGDHDDYDVEDTQRSQVYKGVETVTAISQEAAELTRGQVLTYAGQVVEAVYSSSSGGHTANNEAVWGTSPVPYLRGRPDPYDRDAPDHRWTTSADASAVHRALSRYAGGVTGVRVVERSPSGRAVSVSLSPSGKRISGTQFRSAVNAALGWRTIRSTHIDISASGGRYTFRGRGFGHGVGMSQYGARGHARAGASYEEILRFYFQGTDLAFHDGTGLTSAPLASRPEGLRRKPTRRSVAWGLEPATSESDRVEPAPPPSATPSASPEAPRERRIDHRPVWVVREALPNGDRVRSRPTPRSEARAAADSTQRIGWTP
ncbi:MAG: SpoIID/LytB domain-containing protein [Bacteroidota bacterium]